VILYLPHFFVFLFLFLYFMKHSLTLKQSLAEKALLPFDEKWKGRNVYPVRHGEGSIFLSIASYRDHRLENTLKEAFSKAEHPEKLFVGVVMQNCFEDCKTGVHRVSPIGEKVSKDSHYFKKNYVYSNFHFQSETFDDTQTK
jgi:hypothetical protein